MDEHQANHELALLYAKICVEHHLIEYPKAPDDSIMFYIKAAYNEAMQLYDSKQS